MQSIRASLTIDHCISGMFQKRRDILIRSDARFGVDRNRTLRERLVQQPRAGNAWNADHVTAVHQVQYFLKWQQLL